MAGGGEATHVGADLGDDRAGGGAADATDLIQPVGRRHERGDQLLELVVQLGDVSIQPSHPGQHLGQQEPVMVAEVPGEGLLQDAALGPQLPDRRWWHEAGQGGGGGRGGRSASACRTILRRERLTCLLRPPSPGCGPRSSPGTRSSPPLRRASASSKRVSWSWRPGWGPTPPTPPSRRRLTGWPRVLPSPAGRPAEPPRGVSPAVRPALPVHTWPRSSMRTWSWCTPPGAAGGAAVSWPTPRWWAPRFGRSTTCHSVACWSPSIGPSGAAVAAGR